MSTFHQFGFSQLVQQVGAIPLRSGRGKWGCPSCGGKACLSVNAEKQVFNCFLAGCDLHGGIGTLMRSLGLRSERISRAEYTRLYHERKRANEAAEELYERVKARQTELLDFLHRLSRAEVASYECGLEGNGVWNQLRCVYQGRPKILAELAVLEHAGAADVVRLFAADFQTRQHVFDRVLARGGLQDTAARFVEVSPLGLRPQTNQAVPPGARGHFGTRAHGPRKGKRKLLSITVSVLPSPSNSESTLAVPCTRCGH